MANKAKLTLSFHDQSKSTPEYALNEFKRCRTMEGLI